MYHSIVYIRFNVELFFPHKPSVPWKEALCSSCGLCAPGIPLFIMWSTGWWKWVIQHMETQWVPLEA